MDRVKRCLNERPYPPSITKINSNAFGRTPFCQVGLVSRLKVLRWHRRPYIAARHCPQIYSISKKHGLVSASYLI